MKVKTYGVPGLTEWHGKLKAGSIEVAVSFVGGTASPSGAQPAYFMTKDPIVQLVIENSKEFKSGFISLIMQQEVPGEHRRMAMPKPKPAPVVEAPKEPAVAPAPTDETTTTVQVEQPAETGAADEGADGGEGDADGAGDAETGTGNKITVADKSDAIEWLKEHYPEKKYTATALRTKSAFDAACNECGVEFEFTAE